MKSRFEIFLDTEVYLSHLNYYSGAEGNLLLKCLSLFDGCYTSVVNASEIFSACSSESILQKAKQSLYGTGILGIPYRYSLKAGEVLGQIKKKS